MYVYSLFLAPLALWFYKMFALDSSCTFLLLWLWIRPLLQAAPIPFPGKCLETKIWASSVLITAGVSLLLGPVSGETEEIYVWMLTHSCAHICLSVSSKPWLFTDTLDSRSAAQSPFSSSSFLIFNFLLPEWGLWDLPSVTGLRIWSVLVCAQSNFWIANLCACEKQVYWLDSGTYVQPGYCFL